jgi:hypothetical protein
VALVSPECACTGVVLGAAGGEWTVTPPAPRQQPVRPAENTPEAVLALLPRSLPGTATAPAPDGSADGAATMDDAALERERHLFWTRLQGG